MSALYNIRLNMAKQTYGHWLRTANLTSRFQTITCTVNVEEQTVTVDSPGCDPQTFRIRASWD